MELGKGFSERALAYYRKLYSYYPNWQILQTRLQNLSWSHIQTIIGEEDEKARDWYLAESSNQMWSVKTLERNIGSKYYHRLLASSNQSAVENANKLFRQYFPRGTDFNLVSQHELDQVQYKINRRPREKLNFSTPKTEFYKNFV